MKEKENLKNYNKPGLAKEIILIVLCLLFFVIYHSYRTREDRVNQLLSALEESRSKNIRVLKKYKQKRLVFNELKTDQGVERVAREKLKLVKKGEILYIPQKKHK